MNLTSTTLPHGESEFDLAGLTPESSRLVRPPRVHESPGSLECKLLQIIDLPRGRQGRQYHVILGEVVAVHIDDEVVVDGGVDVMKLSPMARMGGFDYTFVNFLEVIPRPAGGE
jgi:flavin reductase (DIM6/NTAB) family NADH-FMN oxidoreductase RutF